MSDFVVGGVKIPSRLIIGTGKFGSPEILSKVIEASGATMATLAIKRVDVKDGSDNILAVLKEHKMQLLPNTSGAKTAKEAIFAAHLAREALDTNFIKIEIHPDERHLLPDPIETYEACKQLVKDGFVVMPYIHADVVLAQRLADVGVACIMPLGSCIGSNQGLKSEAFIKLILDVVKLPVIVDAGVGSPADAALAMQWGCSGVMSNTAISSASDPIAMAKAMAMAIEAGHIAYEAKLGAVSNTAIATSPMDDFIKEAKEWASMTH